jgi:DNA repair exonuclease SbcCD ATPase subunit
VEVSLEDRGLVLIQGENKADSSANSNGAGKSSIADALCWAIYGVTARGETGDAIINNTAGKNTRVEIQILDHMSFYRIVRHRKHKTGKNSLQVFLDEGYGEKDLTKGTDKLTQEVVDKIIGASLEVFTGSIYAGQERMPDLPSMTDKMLKVLIEEAAGVTALEAAYKKARENAAAAKTDLTYTENHIMGLISQRDSFQSSLEAVVNASEAWGKSRSDTIKSISDNVQTILVPRAKQLSSEAPAEEINRLNAEIASIDTRISSVDQERKTLDDIIAHASLCIADLSRLEVAQALSARRSQDLKANLDAVDHKIGCPCDTCGRPLTNAELAATKASAQSALAKSLGEYKQSSAAKDVAKTALDAAQRAVNDFRSNPSRP